MHYHGKKKNQQKIETKIKHIKQSKLKQKNPNQISYRI